LPRDSPDTDTVRAAQVLTALFDASGAIEDRRLPELFCGFPRAGERRPVPYPVACRPQAWAAGSLFLLLQAALGLRIEAWDRRLMLRCAVLPPWLQRLEIRGLRVADARVDLRVNRGHFGAAVEVMDRRATSTSSSASDQIGDDLQRFRPTGSGLRRTWRSPAATWCSTRSGSSMAVSTPP